jgi:hypothetical protein
LLLLLLQFKTYEAPNTARGRRQDRRFPRHKERFLLYAAPTWCARRLCAHLPLVNRFGAESAHARLSRCALRRGAPWAVTGVPSLALRCARSQAPPPAAREILGGAANVPPVPPGAAQVCTPMQPRLNQTGDGQGACLGRRQRLRRSASSTSQWYTNKHFDARTRARMHAPLLTRSHTHSDGQAHTRTVTFRHTHAHARTRFTHTRTHAAARLYPVTTITHSVGA